MNIKPEKIEVFNHEKFVVTTANKPDKELVIKARKLAKELGTRYVSRRKLAEYKKQFPIDFFYSVEKERLVIRWGESGTFFFHPASSKMRMRNIRHNQRDYLIETLALKGDEQILDLTLGLGSEAILMGAYIDTGKIVGVEASKHIYTIVKYGMKQYVDVSPWVNKSMTKIDLVNRDFKEYIRELPDNSFDIVYCDPMFENPVMTSSSLNAIRPFAAYEQLELEDVEEMKRVAKKMVLLKALEKDSLFERIKTDTIVGSKSSGVLYGVIEK